MCMQKIKRVNKSELYKIKPEITKLNFKYLNIYEYSKMFYIAITLHILHL